MAAASYTGSNYSQNFDNLLSPVPADNTVATVVLPTGWTFVETGTNANTTIRIDNGAVSTGDTFLYGSTASNERALGALASGSLTSMFGLEITNDTANTLNEFTLSYTGEQWRDGGSATSVVNTLAFAYGLGNTALNAGTFSNASNLDFVAPISNLATNVVLDGNLPANQAALNFTVTGLTWLPGQSLWLRWVDGNEAGNDDGLAIDNVSFAAAGAAPALPTVNLSVSTNTGTEAGATVITVTATASAAVTGNQTVSLAVSGLNISVDDYILSNTVITIPDGQNTGSVTFTVQDDAAIEGSETAMLAIANPSAGIALGTTTTQNITISDNDVSGTLSYSSNTLNEARAFDGSINGKILITLSGDSFTGSNGDDLIATSKATIGNVPAGLTAVLTRTSGTTAEMSFINTADSHANINDVSNISLIFNNAAFASGNAAAVIGSSKNDLGLNFGDTGIVSDVQTFTPNAGTTAGNSDASTALALDANWMIVGDDEASVLRVYPRAGGAAVTEWNFATDLGIGGSELDLEAGTRIGDTVYFIGSHSNKKDGSEQVSRENLFAATVSGTGANAQFSYLGKNSGLENALTAWDSGNAHGKGANYFGLTASSSVGVIPESLNGFSIEGMTATQDGSQLLLAFRAPQSDTSVREKAVIVPVMLAGLISGGGNTTPTFGTPVELDLGGRGIRAIEKSNDGTDYLIITGPSGAASVEVTNDFRLYRWNGVSSTATELDVNLDALRDGTGGSLETIVDVLNTAQGTLVQLLQDNGDTIWPGKTLVSKDLPANEQQFQGNWINIGANITDITAPTLASSAPADNANNVAINANLVFKFDEAVKAGAGSFVLKQTSDNSVVETIAANDSGKVAVAYNTVTLNPTAVLANSTAYYVEASNNALTDHAGNAWAGLSGSTAYNFSTASAQTVLNPGDVLFLGANGDVTDAFAFVLMQPVVAGTEIGFTDRNYSSATGMPATGEAAYLWTADQNYPAGTLITIQPDQASPNNPIADKGMVQGAGGGISTTSETIYAFQGNIDGLGNGVAGAITVDRLLASINVGGAAAGDIPAELITVGASISFTIDNALYSGSLDRSNLGTFANLVKNTANYATSDTTAFPLLNNSLFGATKISAVQGSGSASPINTQAVTVEGIITAYLPNLKGFFIQEEMGDHDADINTSEGVLVYYNATVLAGLNTNSVGDIVRVSGTVSEYNGLTEIINPTQFAVTTDNIDTSALPAPVQITLPVADMNLWESVEGMLVEVSSATGGGELVVTDNYNLGRYGQVTLTSDTLLNQFTEDNYPSVASYTAYQATVQKDQIILDDGNSIQNPDPNIFGRGGNPLSASNSLRAGDAVSSVVGVVDQFNNGSALGYETTYRVQATQTVNFSGEPRPTAASLPANVVNAEIKVASANVLNYFTTLGTASFTNPYGTSHTGRGASNTTEFTRQQDKIVANLLGLNADVVGLMEIQNNGFGDETSAIDALVDALNAVAGVGTYAYIAGAFADGNGADAPTAGDDAIMVGIIYKPGKVTPIGQAAVPDVTDPAYDAFTATYGNRVPVAQTFRANADNEEFTLVVNHFKSKGSVNDPDIGDGQGNNNLARMQAAQDLLTWLGTNPTGSTDSDILLVGDFNAYGKEDPITYLDNNGYNKVSTGLSYSFDGLWGSLDHALASDALSNQVSGTVKWAINAEEAIALDYNTEFKSAGQVSSFYAPDAYRSSDHNPILIGLNLNAIVNIAPVFVSGNTGSVAENASIATVIYAAQTTDSNPNDTPSYSLKPGVGDVTWVSINASSGAVTLNAPANFEAKNSYSFTVVATDEGGLSAEQAVTVSVANVNEAPTAVSLNGVQTYVEDTALNLTNIVASDVDSANLTATITLSNPSAGSLTTATSGAVTSTFNAGVWTASGAIADVNALLAGVMFTPALNDNSTVTLTNVVSDGEFSVTGARTLSGTAVNDAPTLSSVNGVAVDEDQTASIAFAALHGGSNAADVDGAVTAFVVKNVGNGSLKIGSSQASSSAWDAVNNNTIDASRQAYWTPDAHSNGSQNAFSVVAKDDGGLESATPVAVVANVVAVNDAPTATNLNASEIYSPNTPLNLTDIVIDDVDSADVTATLTLSNAGAGSLSTAASGAVASTYNAGVWTASGAIADVNALLAGVVFTPTNGFTGNFTVASSVTDGIAPPVTGSKDFIELVVTANTAPTDVTLSPSNIDENSANNSLVGTLHSMDSNIGDTFGYTLVGVGNDNAAFSISGNQLLINASPNFETKANYNLLIRSTDSGSLFFEKALTVNINNLNEASSGTVAIDGIAAKDQILTAINNLSDLDGIPGSINHQWQAGGVNISGATASTYTVQATDVGKAITVVASYIDGSGSYNSVTSSATAAVLKALNGTTNADNITGTANAEALFGLLGNDTLKGSGGNDILVGAEGNDSLDGGTGADTLLGGADNDTYVVDNIGDNVIENLNEGTDTVKTSMSYGLSANVENLTISSSAAINGTGNDLGNKLTGFTGANSLDGGLGNDTLAGGGGNDTLTGGEGNDTFSFETALSAAGVDTLTDFAVADDTIQLKKAVFTKFTTGVLPASQFKVGAAAVDSDDYVVYDDSNGKLYYDTDGSGATAATHIANIGIGLIGISNADFFVIA